VSIWFQGLSQGYPHPEGIIFHGVLLDISARIVQEHEKESLLSEVSLRKDEMEAMLYTMSHDLRSPLVNIQGFATEAKALIEEYLENSTPEILKEATGRLQTVLQNTDRISKLISLLLEAGRHSRDSLNISVVDANAIMHEVLSSYSWRDLQMRVVVHQEHLSCQADAKRLKQVFKKVIENCVAYRKPEQPGEIQIHFSAVNAHLEIVIKDNGIGIEAKQAEMIFDAFTQVNPNKGRHGMGLTLARLLLRRMGGSIYAAGIPGVGMTVTLKLPISHGLV
jgi:signal transduction histidine kinase